MRHLLDVNALIALAHRSHVRHARALGWFQATRASGDALGTCAITELGFVRVAVQADVASARKALEQLKKSSPVPFELLADDLGADRLPGFAKTPAKLMDGHLLELARRHQAQLVTLDTGIPGALLVP
ncbi:MAG: PIN domain-containing protein [Opitutaceae bacterium]